jgi:hypothetical protein
VTGAIGEDPNLQKMGEFAVRRVEFTVGDAGSGGHALHFTGANCGDIAEAIPVGDGSFEDHGDDFHIAVAVGAEALAWIDPIVVNYPQAAEAHVLGVLVAAEGKRMVAVEPAVVGMAAIGGKPKGFHIKTNG